MVDGLRCNDMDFFKQVFLQQFNETMVYIKRKYRADHEDAYDATMDTLLDFRRRFVEGKLAYGNLRFLFTKMSAQMYLRNKKTQHPIQSSAVFDLEPMSEESAAEVPDTFKKVWKKFGEKCKHLLTMHYYGNMQLIEIAEELSQSPATIRKRKERCIAKLKEEMLKIS